MKRKLNLPVIVSTHVYTNNSFIKDLSRIFMKIKPKRHLLIDIAKKGVEAFL